MGGPWATAMVAVLLVIVTLLGCSRSGSRSQVKTSAMDPSDFFDNGKTVKLCRAVSSNDMELLKKLVKQPTASDIGKKGMTPLLWALLQESPEAVELLLKAGADPHVLVESNFGLVRRGVERGFSSIHVAAGMDDPLYLKLFLENGADVNLVGKAVGKQTPLFRVVNRIPNVQDHLTLLVANGANLDHLAYGVTAPMWAVHFNNRFDSALRILEAGSNPRATMVNGKTRLVHLLLRDPVLSRQRTPKQQKDYAALLDWLDKHGEPIEKAKAEVATGEY